MTSFDTNIAVHAANAASPLHRPAYEFLLSLASRRDVAICELMPAVWKFASAGGFAFRRIIDVRLGLTLRHHGVRRFATTNGKDFEGLGFDSVWNPLGSG